MRTFSFCLFKHEGSLFATAIFRASVTQGISSAWHSVSSRKPNACCRPPAGHQGQSVRETSRMTGADVKSWAETITTASGRRRPARTFLIQARHPVLPPGPQAGYILPAACHQPFFSNLGALRP